MNAPSFPVWVLIPAAGVGRRMGAPIPKQYLDLAGRPVIEHTLRLFLEHPQVADVLVAMDPDDDHWPGTSFADHPRIRRVDGGRERCHSVSRALDVLVREADEADWVLVHDAARPCLRREDLDRLLTCLADHPVGGLLGIPVRDTIKQVHGNTDRPLGESCSVQCTIPRERLWHAYTPQMFRLGLLHEALHAALNATSKPEHPITDDASAIELLGLEPLLVEGHADNIKITRPEDLGLAEFFLRRQGRLSR